MMTQLSSLTVNSSTIFPPATEPVAADTISTIVFGIFAVIGTFIAAWQGHRAWKIWHQGHPNHTAAAGMQTWTKVEVAWSIIDNCEGTSTAGTTLDIELQLQDEPGHHGAYPTYSPPRSEVLGIETYTGVTPSPLPHSIEHPGVFPTPIPPP